MELHAVEEGVIVDRAGMCGAPTKGVEVGLSRPSEIVVGDRRKRQQLDLVDLDRHRPAPVDASDLDLRSRPQPVGNGDGSIRYSIAEINAELHHAIVTAGQTVTPAFRRDLPRPPSAHVPGTLFARFTAARGSTPFDSPIAFEDAEA